MGEDQNEKKMDLKTRNTHLISSFSTSSSSTWKLDFLV